jgi:hypothetical protein
MNEAMRCMHDEWRVNAAQVSGENFSSNQASFFYPLNVSWSHETPYFKGWNEYVNNLLISVNRLSSSACLAWPRTVAQDFSCKRAWYALGWNRFFRVMMFTV